MLVTSVTRHGGSTEEAEDFMSWFQERGVKGVERSLKQAEEEVLGRARNRARVEVVAESLFPYM